ncbi:hypothetical protein DFO77_103121 [Marinilabilia salmonicolor]|uniref:Uncharacterized protein n=1 Tax=Marinilabilia salmonicolor TaxID=989 RepID=A0A368VC02_9BACT|nr:hypothetical protein DFO77_103121 [Marinilabilia salmonicolor]
MLFCDFYERKDAQIFKTSFNNQFKRRKNKME